LIYGFEVIVITRRIDKLSFAAICYECKLVK
jgi:hypothetical protein